jgi:hypothetical protein
MIRMDAVHQKRSQPIESDDGNLAPARDGRRTLNVVATYRLSEEGRKLSLISGGDGRAVQQLTVAVPANRLHLVSVNPDGVAMLRLHPQYHLNADLGIVRNDAPPIYDSPPSVEELFKDAARNHQLERAYNIERGQSYDRIRETKFEAHQRLAERFLNTPEMRALGHPKPTPRQCYLNSNGRAVLFDTKQDRDLARQVPPEAYRRFTADERARRERGIDIFTRQETLHDERLRFIAEWVATRGSADQQARHAAGMLPLKEFLEALANEAFAVVRRPQYTYDAVERLQRYLRRFPKYSGIVLARADVAISTVRAGAATDAHWTLKQELEDAIPGAKTTMRIHWLTLKRDPAAPKLTQCGVLLFKDVGPFTVKREWLVTEPAPHRVSSSNDTTNIAGLQKNLIEEQDPS